MLDRPTKAIFGTPGSIDAARLFKLPLPMQVEGVRLLFEMGQSIEQVRARLRLSARQVQALANADGVFSGDGEGIGQDHRSILQQFDDTSPFDAIDHRRRAGADSSPARPSEECIPSCVGGTPAIVRRTAGFAGAEVQSAAALEGPLLQEFDGIHRAADRSRAKGRIVHKDRRVEIVCHRFLRSVSAALRRLNSKHPRSSAARSRRRARDIGSAIWSFKAPPDRGRS